jgi:[ribosomal protein S18]-alanine N-acetyltransferase
MSHIGGGAGSSGTGNTEGHARSDSSETVVLRPMLEGDMQAILEIEKVSFISPWTVGMFLETLASAAGEGYVLSRGSETLGYVIFYSLQDEAHILNIAVAPHVRGKRFGERLLTEIISLFRERRIRDVYLDVREGNHAARKLYVKLGFHTIGRRKRYYRETGEDALVMNLSIW